MLLSKAYQLLMSMTYNFYCLRCINFKGVREKIDCTDLYVIKPTNQVLPSSGFMGSSLLTQRLRDVKHHRGNVDSISNIKSQKP